MRSQFKNLILTPFPNKFLVKQEKHAAAWWMLHLRTFDQLPVALSKVGIATHIPFSGIPLVKMCDRPSSHETSSSIVSWHSAILVKLGKLVSGSCGCLFSEAYKSAWMLEDCKKQRNNMAAGRLNTCDVFYKLYCCNVFDQTSHQRYQRSDDKGKGNRKESVIYKTCWLKENPYSKVPSSQQRQIEGRFLRTPDYLSTVLCID